MSGWPCPSSYRPVRCPECRQVVRAGVPFSLAGATVYERKPPAAIILLHLVRPGIDCPGSGSPASAALPLAPHVSRTPGPLREG